MARRSNPSRRLGILAEKLVVIWKFFVPTSPSAAGGSSCSRRSRSCSSLAAMKPGTPLVSHTPPFDRHHRPTISIREYVRRLFGRRCTSTRVSSAFYDDVSTRVSNFSDDVSTLAFSFFADPRFFPGEACWNTSNNNERNVLHCRCFPFFIFFFFLWKYIIMHRTC